MNQLNKIFFITHMVMMLVVVNYVKAEVLNTSCDEIPKLLCCTDRVLEKCLPGCIEYVSKKCPHKLQKYDTIDASKKPEVSAAAVEVSSNVVEEEQHKVEPQRRHPTAHNTVHETAIPETLPHRPNNNNGGGGGARAHGAVSGIASAPKPTGNRARQFADLPQEGFIEQSAPVGGGSGFSGSSGRHSSAGGSSRSGGDYDQLNPQYPVTEVTDADLNPECGTAKSKPPFSPCIGRKAVDDLFLSCCRQHVSPSCHSLCTYEHREHVAAETLIAAVQSDGCDLRQLSSVLYCANQNRDNRECCEHLSLSSPTLGVGERCLRFCNIARSGQTVGTVEKNDLVCLSNWNVIMYCARAGLRTIN
uniref:Domain of unknown function DB domain-containing protein n=1 Tax=Panagrolaimus superbus TaxID=310955 RepID=A0A914Y8W7_9BILA